MLKKTILLVAGLFILICFPKGVPASGGSLLWNVPIGVEGYTWSTPVVIGSYVYMQDQEGGIGCHKTADGEKVWYKSLSTSWNVSSPVYSQGKLYLFAASTLYCLDASDGSILRRFKADSDIESQAPAISDDGYIYFSTWTQIYALDINTFGKTWTQYVDSAANLIVNNGVVYAVSDRLYALNPANGNVYWEQSPPAGDGFYVGAANADYLVAWTWQDTSTSKSTLAAYQLNTDATAAPTRLWTADMENMADNSPPVIYSGNVYATSREGVLRTYALNGSGTALWERTVRSSGTASALAIVLDGKVFVQEENSGAYSLVCLNAITGALTWQSSKKDMPVAWGQPVLVDNVVYVATDHSGDFTNNTGGLFSFDAGTVSGGWYMMKQNPALTGYDNGYSPQDTTNGGGDSDNGENNGNSDNTTGQTPKSDDGSNGGCFIVSIF